MLPIEQCLESRLDFVGQGPDAGTLCRIELAHTTQHAGELTFLAKVLDPELFELVKGFGSGDRLLSVLLERRELSV